jgi:hypothetical protein
LADIIAITTISANSIFMKKTNHGEMQRENQAKGFKYKETRKPKRQN